jgi:hypothetical protein
MSRIYLLEFNADTTIKTQDPVEIQGGANGSPTLRIQAPFDTDNYTCSIDFLRSDGFIPDRKSASFKSTVLVDVDGDEQTWFRFEYNFGSDVTKLDTGIPEAILKGTVRFLNKIDSNLDEAMTLADFTIQQNVDGSDVEIPPSEVQRIDGDINDLQEDKRDRSTVDLTTVDYDETNYVTYDQTSGTGQGEHKGTVDDLIVKIKDEIGDTTGTIAYPTITPAKDELNVDIVSPLTGNPVPIQVSDVNDPRFDKNNEFELSAVLVSTGVPQIVSEGLYELGFLNREYQSLVYTESIFTKKLGNNISLITEYYKYSDDLGLAGTPFATGSTVAVNTDIYAGYSKLNSINNIEFDVSLGERVYTVTYATGTAGDTIFAKIMDSIATFATWQLPTGGALANKIDKIPNAVEDNLACQLEDGSLKDCGIAADNVALKSDKGIPNGYASLDADGKHPANEQRETVVNYIGTFGSAGSFTGGDVPSSGNTIGDKYVCDEDGFVSTEAGETFDTEDTATYNSAGTWDKNTATNKVISVAGKSGIVTLVKGDVGLGNADNTSDADKEISTAAATKNASQDLAIAEKIDGVIVNDIPAITEIEFIGGSTVTNPESGKVTVDIFGTGTGEGQIILGQVDITPLPAIPTSYVEMDLTLQSIQSADDGQSTDETVFKLFPSTDGVIPNTMQVYQTASLEDDNDLEYRTYIQGSMTNTNTGTPIVVTFKLEKDEVVIWEKSVLISQASIQNPLPTNNFSIEEFFRTNPLADDEDIKLFIMADSAGSALVQAETHYTSNFVSGEALPDIMRTPTYDVDKLGKVDNAQSAEGVEEIATTNPSLALLSSLKTGTLITDRIYTIEMQGTLTANDMQWSPAGDATIFDIFEADGITNAQGTDHNTFPNISAKYDGTKLILQAGGGVSDAIDVDLTPFDDISSTNVQDGMEEINDKVNINTTNIGTNTTNIANKLDKVKRAILGGGALINSSFAINQREVTGTVILAAGEYGHDRFRAGAGGCTYTFATSLNVTTITISAGTLEQEILGTNIQSDDYILHWQGTAEGQIDGGGFAGSPVTDTLVGGVNSIVEFDTGTLIIPKLERGTVETEFIPNTVSAEDIACKHYYWRGYVNGTGAGYRYGGAGDTDMLLGDISFNKMRILPVGSVISSLTAINVTLDGVVASDSSILVRGNVNNTGKYRLNQLVVDADAEL